MEYDSHISDNVGTLVQIASADATYTGPMSFHNHRPAAYQSSSGFQSDASTLMLPSSNDIELPMNMTASHSTGWAAKEEWTKHEADIKQLYVHEKKPLKEVKSLMESQHGFRATDKMYKTHIKQWGLDKKNKEPEMRAIVRKHQQRTAQGKPSTIHVRGQIRNIEEAFRYWERKGVSIDKIIARQAASPTPEAVKFFTPVPSPILTPQVLAIPEHMFRATSDYIKGSFESGMWYDADPLSECRSIKDKNNANDDWTRIDNECDLACSLFNRELPYEAEQTLRKVIINIERVLLAEVPSNLTRMFDLIVHLRGKNEAKVASVIFRQFSIMSKALLGSEHPVRRICEWLDKLYESDFGDIAIRCVQIIVGHLESSVGPLHLSTLYSRIDLIRVETQRGKARMQKYERLLGECEKALRSEDPRVMELREWTADECCSEGCYDDAMSLIQTNIAPSQDQSLMSTRSWECSSGLYTLARCQHALGDVELGIATLHQAIDIEVSEWGTQHPRARCWLLYLEHWYLEQDLLDSAAVARDLRLITLESIDVN